MARRTRRGLFATKPWSVSGSSGRNRCFRCEKGIQMDPNVRSRSRMIVCGGDTAPRKPALRSNKAGTIRVSHRFSRRTANPSFKNEAWRVIQTSITLPSTELHMVKKCLCTPLTWFQYKNNQVPILLHDEIHCSHPQPFKAHPRTVIHLLHRFSPLSWHESLTTVM